MTISANGTHLIFNDNTTQNTAPKPVTSSIVAWVSFNGSTTPTINGSDNVSGVTYNGAAGKYTVSFPDLGTDAYAVSAIGYSTNPDGEMFAHVLSQTSTSVQVQFSNASDARVNSGAFTSVAIMKTV